MNLAPIALFVYNRLEYTKKTIISLQRNPLSEYSKLYIFSDFGKNKDDLKKVLLVRNYLSKIKGFKSIKIILRKKNYGLRNNILSGINYIFKLYNTIIVIEDDIVTSKYFLNYMNQNLKIYEFSKKVISVHGYNYPINMKGLSNFFFIKGADCWGWSTWKKKWKKYYIDKSDYLAGKISKDKKIKEFNFNNSYDFYKMLTDNKKNKKSWAINWYASAFIKDLLTLYPKKTLVKNIGLVGTNSYNSSLNINSKIDNKFYKFKKLDEVENLQAKRMMRQFLKRMKLNERKIKIFSLLKFFLKLIKSTK
jgi:hypothetical protein